jgi:KipI family sensor histidine kinase inhibitor
MSRLTIVPAGDKALAIKVGDTISPEINLAVRNLSVILENQQIPAVLDIVPTYCSILINYDPLISSLDELAIKIKDLGNNINDSTVGSPRTIEIPTVYGGIYGPELGYVAQFNGLTELQVIDIHSGTDYLVYAMGFTPGFTYLGGLSDKIVTPRLQTPRTEIPAGSVGIAEQQTGIYPIESPGGWQLIGRTPVNLFDPTKSPPVIVEPGDYIRFVQISSEEYERIASLNLSEKTNE